MQRILALSSFELDYWHYPSLFSITYVWLFLFTLLLDCDRLFTTILVFFCLTLDDDVVVAVDDVVEPKFVLTLAAFVHGCTFVGLKWAASASMSLMMDLRLPSMMSLEVVWCILIWLACMNLRIFSMLSLQSPSVFGLRLTSVSGMPASHRELKK